MTEEIEDQHFVATQSEEEQMTIAVARSRESGGEAVEKQEREMEALLAALRPLQLKKKQDVPYDGDCFFHSVVGAHRRLGRETAKSLRGRVVAFIRSQDCPESLKGIFDDEFLRDLAIPHVPISDQRAIEATACLLRVKLVVYTVDVDSTDRVVDINRHGHRGPAVRLGNIAGKHFVPLKTKGLLAQLRWGRGDESSTAKKFSAPSNLFLRLKKHFSSTDASNVADPAPTPIKSCPNISQPTPSPPKSDSQPTPSPPKSVSEPTPSSPKSVSEPTPSSPKSVSEPTPSSPKSVSEPTPSPPKSVSEPTPSSPKSVSEPTPSPPKSVSQSKPSPPESLNLDEALLILSMALKYPRFGELIQYLYLK